MKNCLLVLILILATTASGQAYRNDRFVRTHCLISSKGKRLAASPSPRELIAAYEAQPAKPLVLYFHGGLVSEDDGIRSAKYSLAENAFPDSICFPIFNIWKSNWQNEIEPQADLATKDDLNQTPPDVPNNMAKYLVLETYLRPFGVYLWHHIKSDVSASFRNDGASTELIEVLEKERARIPRIVLVGHSTGAAYILKFIDAYHKVELRDHQASTQFDVIFLAPACSYQFVADKLQSWYNDGYQPFRTFHLFGLNDSAERANGVFGDAKVKDQLTSFIRHANGLPTWLQATVGVVGSQMDGWGRTAYGGSLLYLVSIFESPVLLSANPPTHCPLIGLQCCQTPVLLLRNPPGDPADNLQHMWVYQSLMDWDKDIVWGPTNEAPPRSCSARSHSDFTDDVDTARSMSSLVRSFASDLYTDYSVHVLRGSTETNFTASSSPTRHLTAYTASGILQLGLDRQSAMVSGNGPLQQSASISVRCPTGWAAEARTLNCLLTLKCRRTPKASAQITVRTDDSNPQVIDLKPAQRSVTFSVPASKQPYMELTINIKVSRNDRSDWAAVTLHDLSVQATR